MKIRSLAAAAAIGAMILLAQGAAEAAEIKVLSAGGMRPVMEDLGPKFERASGHKLAITFDFPPAVVKRVQDGESADVVMLPQREIESLVKDGKAVADNVTVIASAGIGVAVRKGAPKPDISSPEALKRTLLAAKSITYGNPAQSASGRHFAKVLDRLGIANEMKSKMVFTKTPGAVGDLVAKGEAEIGVNQFQDFIRNAGVEIVGPLPGDLQDTIVFSAAIMAGARDAAASKALVNFLRTPEAATVIKAQGLEAATP